MPNRNPALFKRESLSPNRIITGAEAGEQAIMLQVRCLSPKETAQHRDLHQD